MSMADRKAASVLPDPVGAMTSVASPVPIASQAALCAAVGAANEAPNHSRVGALKRSSAVPRLCSEAMRISCPAAPTCAGAWQDRGVRSRGARVLGSTGLIGLPILAGVLGGCSAAVPAAQASGETLDTMPVWVVVLIGLCLAGAGVQLWHVRHPLPPDDAQSQTGDAGRSDGAGPADDAMAAADDAATRAASGWPVDPDTPQLPPLTPAEFGLTTVLIGTPPRRQSAPARGVATDPGGRDGKMTPESPSGHTRTRARARPLPGGWPPPHPLWRDPE